MQGLAAGTLDCAIVGGLSVANGLDRGADIDSLEDLRGKTVATNAVGGSTDYLQDFYIEQQSGLKAP